MAHHYSGPDFSFPHGDARVDHCDLFAFPAPGAASRSVVVIDVHPSFGVNPPGPTTSEPFAPEALYELKVDTNGDGAADVAFRIRFSTAGNAQSATVRRVDGAEAAGLGEAGEIVVEEAPVSTGSDAQVTESGPYLFFAGWRSDPFFFDAEGVLNDRQMRGPAGSKRIAEPGRHSRSSSRPATRRPRTSPESRRPMLASWTASPTS